MLVHRAIERVRALREEERRLRARARGTKRPPLVVIPPMFGTKLIDAHGRKLWGWTSCIYRDSGAVPNGEMRTAGVLRAFDIVPRVVGVDILGGALRFLARTGGYTPGRDLFVLEYDWRHGVAYGAARLAELVARFDEPVDLACASSGGLVARHLLTTHSDAVRRVVYLGTPQRGTLQALSVLRHGFQLVPLARKVPPSDPGAVQITWDLLPHPDERVFVDGKGEPVVLDLYDPEVWREYRLAPGIRDPEPFLRRARETHRALEKTPAHDAHVIGGAHLTTLARIVMHQGRALLSEHCASELRGRLPVHLAPGDGSVPEASLRGLPGARVVLCKPRDHRWLISDPSAQRLMLEALLASPSC